MQFAPQQDRALAAVDTWFRNQNSPIFRLFGYAGTGKTTLARHIAENVDGLVLFAAPTGKAAYVLKTKGCPNTSTIHQLIYTPKEKSQAKLKELQAKLVREKARNPVVAQNVRDLEYLIDIEQKNLRRPSWNLNTDSLLKKAKLLIVDESSMVDESVGEDLLSFGVPILALGDPAQLPPVAGAGFFTKQKADFLLTDIHRQARDNPIIEMSRIVREGGTLNLGRYGDSEVVRGADFQRDWVFQADQILVGKNDTRRAYNARIRELRGADRAYPLKGDKLVCLRNNHDSGLLNGSLWTVETALDTGDGFVSLELQGEESQRVASVAHGCLFHGQNPEWYEKKEADEFDYGYAMTVHKSQGSQWDDVLVIDEWFRNDRKQWLYTALTRAAKTVRVVKM
ncbi:Dda-like helicase [Pseudomonas phage vB_PaeS_PAO1_Ab19]|uniref:Dda-like helicase n=1 Tax=Pseudomonas phage vB_PaeS_PAO1_Ab19 TaxID=1548912 RepID=UPI0018B00A54|nr:Dda-like helicase [Pseudomonas phage vB_PaeS_PAO1_Ab19]